MEGIAMTFSTFANEPHFATLATPEGHEVRAEGRQRRCTPGTVWTQRTGTTRSPAYRPWHIHLERGRMAQAHRFRNARNGISVGFDGCAYGMRTADTDTFSVNTRAPR